VAPQPFLDRMQPSLDRVITMVQTRAVANDPTLVIAPPKTPTPVAPHGKPAGEVH
jgi:hypothetical protein